MGLSNENLLGRNSYPVIVKEIIEKIQKAEAQTLAGSTLLKQVYAKLNESITPMLELKPFITNAEQIAGDDVTLKEILDFITKKSTTGDLNYIINLCKEEHFANLNRINHPNPKQTIESIKDAFGKPSSVIEQGIKNGLFDTLQSSLLGKVKEALNAPKKQKDSSLNESTQILSGNVISYNPVGIKFENIKDNKTVLLTEGQVLIYDRASKLFEAVSSEGYDIPEGYNNLSRAILNSKYNPENNSFSLNENWDLDISLNANGNVTVNGKSIENSKVTKLLTESIQAYESNPALVQNFNKLNYCKAADDFISLVENSNKLILLDKLMVFKNLSESKAILFDFDSVKNASTPKILISNDFKNNLFESYSNLVNYTNGLLKTDVSKLFETELINEQKLITERDSKIVALVECQNDLNTKIQEVDNLLPLAEENSPAKETLASQKSQLNKRLNENIEELNFYRNNYKLY